METPALEVSVSEDESRQGPPGSLFTLPPELITEIFELLLWFECGVIEVRHRPDVYDCEDYHTEHELRATYKADRFYGPFKWSRFNIFLLCKSLFKMATHILYNKNVLTFKAAAEAQCFLIWHTKTWSHGLNPIRYISLDYGIIDRGLDQMGLGPRMYYGRKGSRYERFNNA